MGAEGPVEAGCRDPQPLDHRGNARSRLERGERNGERRFHRRLPGQACEQRVRHDPPPARRGRRPEELLAEPVGVRSPQVAERDVRAGELVQRYADERCRPARPEPDDDERPQGAGVHGEGGGVGTTHRGSGGAVPLAARRPPHPVLSKVDDKADRSGGNQSDRSAPDLARGGARDRARGGARDRALGGAPRRRADGPDVAEPVERLPRRPRAGPGGRGRRGGGHAPRYPEASEGGVGGGRRWRRWRASVGGVGGGLGSARATARSRGVRSR